LSAGTVRGYRQYLEGDCLAGEFPNAVREFEIFDRQFSDTLARLLTAFQAAWNPSDDRVLRFLLLDYHLSEEEVSSLLGGSEEGLTQDEQDERDAARSYLEVDLQSSADLLAWRAIRLGHLIGTFIADYEATHPAGSDLWRSWRSGEGSPTVAQFVVIMPEDHFAYVMLCREIRFLLNLEYKEEPLTLPHDGDLVFVPGALWWSIHLR
jgi:hypothetical protein